MNKNKKIAGIVVTTSIMGVLCVGGYNLKVSNNDLIAENQELLQTVEMLNGNISELNLNIDSMDEFINQLSLENEKLLEEKQALESKNEDLNGEVSTLQNNLKKKSSSAVSAASTTYDISASELKLLETLVYCEVGSESVQSQIAVTNVVLNRVKSSNFPNTIKGVIYQSGQFSPVTDGSLDSKTASDEVKRSVARALNGEKAVSDDTLFFFATWVRSDHPIRDCVKITKTYGQTHFGTYK